MGTVIIVTVLIIICIISIKSYIKKLASGCCGTGGDTVKKARVRDKNESHYPYTVSAEIEGMTCNHCRKRVENMLNSEDGFWAEVNMKNNTALIRLKNKVSDEYIKKVICTAGYSVKSITHK